MAKTKKSRRTSEYALNKERAKNLRKARKALAHKELARVEQKNKHQIAQAKYSARVANRKARVADQKASEAGHRAYMAEKRAEARTSEAGHRAYMAEKRAQAKTSAANHRAYMAEKRAEARKAENYKLHRELRKRKEPAGARVQSVSAMWLAVSALVFAIIFIFLYAAISEQWLGGDHTGTAYKNAQIGYIVFLCLMIASIIGLLILVSPIWGTLKREGHLTGTAKACMIIVWILCAFAFAVFMIDILTGVNLYYDDSLLVTSISDNAKDVLNFITILSPAVLLIFTGVLYGSIKQSYPR